MRALVLAGLLALSACATTAPLPPPPADSWLVGGWVLEGDDCRSDAGVTYNADGTWQSYGVSGRWTLTGSRLDSTVTERWEDVEPSGAETAPPERYVSTVTPLGPDRLRSVASDGVERTLVRCP